MPNNTIDISDVRRSVIILFGVMSLEEHFEEGRKHLAEVCAAAIDEALDDYVVEGTINFDLMDSDDLVSALETISENLCYMRDERCDDEDVIHMQHFIGMINGAALLIQAMYAEPVECVPVVQ